MKHPGVNPYTLEKIALKLETIPVPHKDGEALRKLIQGIAGSAITVTALNTLSGKSK